MESDRRLMRRVAEVGEPASPSPDAGPDFHAPAEERASAAARAFRGDLERIRFSPYFSRLAAVTQVISQGAAGQVVHNRLTHTIKVTAVGRAPADRLSHSPHNPLLDERGALAPVVVQATASAHDLGPPPFGHLGER